MAEQPSLGGAIALQGRNRIAEELGKMQFQMGQKEADRLAKKGLEDAKRIAEIEQKFAIPKGQYHRLVLPEIQKTQAVYLDKVKDLKAQRPNNWQNEIQNLSNQYVGEMEKFETLSKDFNDYDTRTASIDKGNTYFSKEWNKFNTAYENAQTLDDFKTKLGQSGFDPTKASDFIVRPNGSISYSPFTNQKPLETLVSQIEKFDGVKVGSKTSRDQFGNLVTEDIKLRPLTYEEADKIKNDPALAGLYSNVAQLPSIEATLDSIIETNPYFAIQYADQRNLPLRRNADGTYAQEDVDVIKKDLLQKVQNMREPKTGRSVTFAPRGTNVTVNVGEREEGEMARPVYNYGRIKSIMSAPNSAYRLGELNVSYEKEMPSVQVAQGEVFDDNFKSFTARTLNKVKPDGVLILAVDKNGNPISSVGRTQDDKAKVAGADVFIRLKAGTNAIYYQKLDNYTNLTSQYGTPKGKKDVLDQMIKEMIQKATAYDANVQSIKDQIKD
jgi:hypothetical protein